jgi:hypothetical protein
LDFPRFQEPNWQAVRIAKIVSAEATIEASDRPARPLVELPFIDFGRWADDHGGIPQAVQ